MAVVIGDQTRYKRAEVCRMIGSNRKPFFRWLRDGVFCGAEHRDWRGWRLFTRDQFDVAQTGTNCVIAVRQGF
jgi:hypothetical protein